jgi:SAM-dependent methyltransferase
VIPRLPNKTLSANARRDVYRILLARRITTMSEAIKPAIGATNVATRELWLEGALAALQSGTKILDAGAGELQYRRLCGHLDYTSQDFGEYDGVGDGAGLQTKMWNHPDLDIVSDVTQIPVPASSFGAVMCIEVLEHLPRPIDALTEFSRVLMPGGTLIITAPVASLTHFAPHYFYNGFSRYFYERTLDECGFDVVELVFNGGYYDYIAQEVRRVEDVCARYSPRARKAGFLVRSAKWVMLRRLATLRQFDQGSSELLSFGVHVLARRR